MTIEERLEALTMNLELTARKHEDDHQRLEWEIAAEREARIAEREARIAEWDAHKVKMEHERYRVDVLTTSVEKLLTVSAASLAPIERLERLTA